MSLNAGASAFVPTVPMSTLVNAQAFVPLEPPQKNSQKRQQKAQQKHAKPGTPPTTPRQPSIVNPWRFSYSPTGAVYGAVVRSQLAKADYSPTGACYSAGARLQKKIVEMPPATRLAIARQVDFYFGDANFNKDVFLQKATKKNPGGFVSLKAITEFNKMKKLTKSWRLVAAVVKYSSVVELNVEASGVRRCAANVVEPTINRAWYRTVVVENVSPQASIDSVIKDFTVAGTVDHVRMLKAGKELPQDMTSYMQAAPRPHDALQHDRGCTLVEYSNVEEAQTACVKLTNNSNWRSGLRVTLLWPQKGTKPIKEPVTTRPTSVEPTNSHISPTSGRKFKADKRRQQLYGENPSLARVGSQRLKPLSKRNLLSSNSVSLVNVLRPPSMPDGTRGFATTGMGRGKPIA
eukprot:m.130269 g.130269  ORF g.130269 m.130269 type:complete len:405 (-) comp29468_c1_seq1:1622-2836(-)